MDNKHMHRFSTTGDRLDYEDNPSTYQEPYLSVVEERKLTVHYNKTDVGYLKFLQLNEEGGEIGIYGSNVGSINLLYSYNGRNWNTFPTNSTVHLGNGESIYLKGENNSMYRSTFTMTGLVRASGSIMSLLYGDSYAENLVIPSEGCFNSLFSNCGALIHAPELPATELTKSCYFGMFENTNITNFPTLPAETFAEDCCEDMFSGCTKLRGTGYIKANSCSTSEDLAGMFSGCDLHGALTIIRPSTAIWPVTNLILEGVNVTSRPEEEGRPDTIYKKRLYKTEGNEGNNYYNEEYWYIYYGIHTINNQRYYIWKINKEPTNINLSYYVLTEDRDPECNLEFPYTFSKFLDKNGNETSISREMYGVKYDQDNSILYIALITKTGPDPEEWFEYYSPMTIDGNDYYVWKKVSTNDYETKVINGEVPIETVHSYAILDTPDPVGVSGDNPLRPIGYLSSDQSVYEEAAMGDYFIKYDKRQISSSIRWCRAELEEDNSYADFFVPGDILISSEVVENVFAEQLSNVLDLNLIIGYDNLIQVNLSSLSNYSRRARKITVSGESIKEFIIPSGLKVEEIDLENTSITSIDIQGFSNLHTLKLPQTLNEIRSVESCTSLVDLELPSSLRVINSYAFRGCNSLTHLDLPEGLTTIGNSAFESSRLVEITIPSTVTSLGSYVFQLSRSLLSVTIRPGVTELSRSAFQSCYNLKQVDLPETLSIINSYCFSNCTSLTSITIPKSNVDEYAFANSGVEEVIFQSSSHTLSRFSFYKCSSLTRVEMPQNSIFAVGNYTFKDCSELVDIDLGKIWSFGDNSFENCTGLTSFITNQPTVYFGEDTFKNCTSIETISISAPESYSNKGISSIYESTFAGCTGVKHFYLNSLPKTPGTLKSVISPNTLPNLEDVIIGPLCTEMPGSFEEKTHLISVDIQSTNITEIEDSMFNNCSSLEEVTLPNSITSIGENSFQGTKIIEISIPDSVLSIKKRAFFMCNNLEEITIPNSVTTLGELAFARCDNLKRATLGSGVIEAGQSILSDDSSLEYLSYDFDISLDELDIYSENLKEIIFGDNVTEIASISVHNYAPQIETIHFGSGSELKNSLLRGCSKLKSVTITDGLEQIGEYTFSNCTSLRSIVLPFTVNSIGDYAFSGCTNLSDITSKNPTPPTIKANTFGSSVSNYTGRNTYNQNVNKLHVPRGATLYSTVWNSLIAYNKSGFSIEFDG